MNTSMPAPRRPTTELSSTPALRRPTTDFATSSPSTAKVHDINYILGPSVEKPRTPGSPPARAERNASVSSTGPNSHSAEPESGAVQYTPTTHRVSKAKKGKKVHVCEFGCGKVFTRAEHRKRHEANHRAEPLFKCPIEDCGKPFQRLDLLNRHLERQHGIGPSTGDGLATSPKAAQETNTMGPPPKRLHSSSSSGKNDWNAHRDTIERLYITENRPLKDIKVHMEGKYGFTIVEDRAYEKAFRRLGLSKNIPSSTMEAILTEVEKRRQGGKATTVYWRGQRVNEKRIHRFKQRVARESKSDSVEIPDPPRTFELPEHVRCLTPNNNGFAYPTQQQGQEQEQGPSAESSGGESGTSSYSDEEGEQRPQKRFACTACGEEFSFAGHLVRHAEAHGQRQGLHDCPAPGCPYNENLGFSTRDLLWDHMLSEHRMQ